MLNENQRFKIQKKNITSDTDMVNDDNYKMIEIEFLQYNEFANLETNEKIKKILEHIKLEKIILLDGLLTEEESTELFKKTMEDFDFKFKGIEISSINPQEYSSKNIFKKFKAGLINFLQGKKSGITIIGPATIVKKIKQDPNKISLFMESQ